MTNPDSAARLSPYTIEERLARGTGATARAQAKEAVDAYYTTRLIAAGSILVSSGRNNYHLIDGHRLYDVPLDSALALVRGEYVENSGATIDYTYFRLTTLGWECARSSLNHD